MKKSVLIFILLSVVASGLNYIIYPLLSRALSSAEYVNITVALSLFTQVSAFLSSILAITISLSKSEQNERANEKIELLQAFLFKLFFVLAAVFLVFSPIIMAKIHTPVLFALPISVMMLLSIPILVISGYLNGKNQMIKLGIITLLSASCQFIIGLTVAVVSRNGLLTMSSMAIAQIVTLIIVYTVFSKDRLPGISKSLKAPFWASRSKQMSKLILYTAATSVAIMAVSLIQIMDLFILQRLEHTNIKFYADIYVISRVVFFAGMIFIWPFLGEISVDSHHFNRKPFLKLISYFTLITLAAIVVLYIFGDQLAHALFGMTYDLQIIREIGILSILYKFFFLIITAVVLYFIVLRSYIAVWIALAASGAIFIFSELINKDTSMFNVLIGLNVIAGILVIASVLLLLRVHPPRIR